MNLTDEERPEESASTPNRVELNAGSGFESLSR